MNETSEKEFDVESMESQSFQLPSSRQNFAAETIQCLHRFLRAAEIHSENNKLFAQASLDLFRSLSLWMQITNSDFELRLQMEQIFFSGVRIKPRYHLYRKFHFLIGFLKKRRISSFKIPKEAKEIEVVQFFQIIAQRTSTTLDSSLQELVYRAQLAGFLIEQIGQDNEASPLKATHGIYDGLCQEIEVLTQKLDEAKEEDDRLTPQEKSKLMSLVLSLNDIPSQELNLFLSEFRAVQKHPVPTEVAAFSSIVLFAWARSLSLPIKISGELSTGALLKPLITRGATGLDLSVTETRAAHLLNNLNKVSQYIQLSRLQLISLYEFLIPFGKDGVYESSGTKCYQHFFSRMLRIVTLYAQFLVFDRRRKLLKPAEAVQAFATESMGCDQSLVRLFIHWLGFLPLGSTVKLNSGEWAKVISTQDDLAQTQRPKVLVYKDKNGQSLDCPRIVDLNMINESQGVYQYGIETLETLGEKSEEVEWTKEQLSEIQNAFNNIEI